MNSHYQRLFSLMMGCFLALTTVAGDVPQTAIQKGNNHKAMLIAGASLLLGTGFCVWKLMNYYKSHDWPTGVRTALPDGRTNITTDIPKTVKKLESIEISHGHLTLQHGTNRSLQIVTNNSELSIDQVANLRGSKLRLLPHGSAIHYILTLNQMPKVLSTAGNSTIAGNNITVDTLELRTRDRSTINIQNLTVNKRLSVNRQGASSTTTQGKWNVNVSQNKSEIRGNNGSSRMTTHNRQKTAVEITASEGTSFKVIA